MEMDETLAPNAAILVQSWDAEKAVVVTCDSQALSSLKWVEGKKGI